MPRAMAIVSIVLIGGSVFLLCGLGPIVANRQTGRRRWATYAGSVLIMIGAAGFFGCMLSGVGGLNWLPKSFEWPAGYVSGVVFTDSGLAIVPHQSSGRVQVYGANWQYLGGWHIGSGGGCAFRLKVSDQNLIEVIVGRGQWHRKFDLEGRLLWEETFSEPSFYDTYPDPGVSVFVPTPLWLVPFSHTVIAFVIVVAGMFVLGYADRSRPKRKT